MKVCRAVVYCPLNISWVLVDVRATTELVSRFSRYVSDRRALQVDDSTMPLLGNTKEDDMRIIAEMTINKLQMYCKPTPSAITRCQCDDIHAKQNIYKIFVHSETLNMSELWINGTWFMIDHDVLYDILRYTYHHIEWENGIVKIDQSFHF